ncbi:NAD-P-binding protein [Epithele typhae]|uniref:NAD-P-binding protein n=1 Tax=Epithele typhae TaxID=378194 RepID=UPI002008DD38|nr:NAD-P-binding protein [Epithele typhae]KAH9939069.1 NAD-P-binding protein [Epithele typhae]
MTDEEETWGSQIAAQLAGKGANVLITYVAGADAAAQVAADINSKGAGQAIVSQADAASLEASQRVVKKAVNKWGRLNIVVLNATFDKTFDTNVKGPMFLIQSALPHLTSAVSSSSESSSLTRASMVPPDFLLYNCTKGAVEQMARVLAKDLGQKGITTNVVAPGPIDTDLFRNGTTEQEVAFTENLHPAKRLGQAEEVAKVVDFLVSLEASWVNGQTLMVNGGFVV